MTEPRIACDCGLVRLRASLWRNHGTCWGWPDFLAEHSPEACTRAADGGVDLQGPPMRVSRSRASLDVEGGGDGS